jgi:hypothetical protein
MLLEGLNTSELNESETIIFDQDLGKKISAKLED